MRKIDKSYSMTNTCEKVSKTSIYLLTFLLPILFLPWTANVLDFNKQALLIVLVFIALFSWMLKILISGKAELSINRIHVPIALLLIAYAASTIFSPSRTSSFWGWPQVTSESLISVLGLFLLYFLIVNLFKAKEISYLLISLVFSSFLVMLYGVFQIFGQFILPIDFTKSVSFNTIGGINALAIFVAIMLPLTIIFLITTKNKKLRLFLLLSVILSAVLLLVINFMPAWWVVTVGAALILIFGAQKRDIFDSRWLVLPMFFLAVSLMFIFFKFQVPGLPDRPIEFYLNNRTSLDLSWDALKDSPAVGSGPGTFSYNFSKYKDIEFNKTFLWNMRFDWASSKMLTVFGTLGILGVLSIVLLILFFIFYAFKFFFTDAYRKNNENVEDRKIYDLLGLGVFISFLTVTVAFFFYRSNLSLDFVYFLLMGCFVSLLYPSKKEIILKPSSLTTLVFTFVFTLVFILGLGVLILEGQRYVAAMNYLEGIKSWQQRGAATTLEELQVKTNQTLEKLDTAIKINPKLDLYHREISQVYMQAINEVMVRTDLTQPEIIKLVQSYMSNSVRATQNAIDINPQNLENWVVRGNIYKNLIGRINDNKIKDFAVEAYEKASELEPINPIYPTQAGVAIMTAINSGKYEDEKEKLFDEAKEFFEKALSLKPDYSDANFQLAMLYNAQGKQEEMLKQLEKTKQVLPNDATVAFQLGAIYYEMKDYGKAKTEFERAIMISPNYANALYFLGLTYDQLGDKDMAIATFEQILVNNPDNELVLIILKNLRAGEKALKGIAEESPELE